MAWERDADHFDGERFFNPWANTDRSFREFLRWSLSGARVKWPERVENGTYPLPPEQAEPGEVAVTYVGQATFLVQVPGCNILTDPIFSERASPVSWAGPKRARAPGIAMEALPPIALVLLSHNHYDHMDLPTLRTLQKRWSPKIVTGLGNGDYLRGKGIGNTVDLDWWQSVEAQPGIKVTYVPAQHWSSRSIRDRRKTLWGGHVVQTAAGMVYFAGDSGYGPHFAEIRRRLGAPAVALLPIGAYEPRWFMAAQHMNPADAVQAHIDLAPSLSVAMHFGTFQLTDEGIDAPLEALEAARRERGIPEQAFRAPGFGETLRWRRP